MVATPPQKRVILNTFQDEASPSLRTFVILNLFQDNAPPSPVILKQVQDDDSVGIDSVGTGFLKHILDDDGWRFLHMPLRLAA
jgi:hypothetical protein